MKLTNRSLTKITAVQYIEYIPLPNLMMIVLILGMKHFDIRAKIRNGMECFDVRVKALIWILYNS